MKNFFIKYRIQIKLVLTLLFGVLTFIKWQNYNQSNNKVDLISFAIFSIAFVLNIFDVRYTRKNKIDLNSNE
jgi:divalent metal cation (Fe/Co/Zn/Cd) transporter